jgi:DNA segregation ATPase FtsK/SpoIIIE, S-DNA-T family
VRSFFGVLLESGYNGFGASTLALSLAPNSFAPKGFSFMAEFAQMASGFIRGAQRFFNLDARKQFERDAVFILAIGGCCFLTVALATFHPFEIWMYSSANAISKTHNIAGPFGNKMAGALIFYMGLSACTLPMLLLQLAWHMRSGTLRQSVLPVLTGWLTLLTSLMPLLCLLQPTLPIRGVAFASGGAFGQVFSTHLHDTAGIVGSHIILWSALAASLILISRLELTDLFSAFAGDDSPQKIDASILRATSLPDAPTQPLSTAPERFFGAASPANQLANTSVTSGVAASTTTSLVPYESEDVFQTIGASGSSLGDEAPLMSSPDHFAPQRPYCPPPIETFKRADERTAPALSLKELEATGGVLTKTLSEFGVEGKIIGWQPGPVVTVYEYQPDAGIKQSKILSLMDDLALSLKVDSIFILPVPGKRALGIQVPNSRREIVYLGDIIASESFQKNPSPLTFAMGKTISGLPYTADLTAMPHLLAAGATGTGKSVGINSLLCSIIMKSSPEDVRMILVDPKMLELSVYDGIPHLLMPVITEPDRASSALKWAANEMERRYKIMQHAQVRNIGGFNAFWEGTGETRREQIRGLMNDPQITRLPYILLVIDELADLMLTAPKDVEGSIQRLAQKARASGIHMVLATQRPSVDVITGVIKANLPCRLSFQVVSKHDSRTILDQMGAEKLLGRGDVLLQRPGVGRLERLQGALVSDEEVLALVAATKKNYNMSYDERAMGWIDEEVTRNAGAEESEDGFGGGAASDPKWEEALNIGRTHGVVSASFLQRHLQIGYNRAARMVEGMEAKGIVAKADGSKPRKWLGG